MLKKDQTFTMLVSYLKNNSSNHSKLHLINNHFNFYNFNKNIFQTIEGAKYAQINY
jgi:hypothetical protein